MHGQFFAGTAGLTFTVESASNGFLRVLGNGRLAGSTLTVDVVASTLPSSVVLMEFEDRFGNAQYNQPLTCFTDVVVTGYIPPTGMCMDASVEV